MTNRRDPRWYDSGFNDRIDGLDKNPEGNNINYKDGYMDAAEAIRAGVVKEKTSSSYV